MQDVKIEKVAGIGWVVLARPAVRNAARPQMMQEVCEALDALIADTTVRGIGITGEGPHFLAGGDFEFLDEIAGGSSMEAYASIYAYFQGVTRRLFRCPKPTAAAISGGAITVGCEIALACDLRIADDTAFFEESWLHMGLIPPLGGALLLPRYVGLTKAKEMVLEAKRMRADEALQSGLVNELVPVGQVRDAAQKRLEAMSAFPATAFRLAKEALHRGLESSMESEWQANVMAQGILLGSEEFRQRVEQRRPGKRGSK
jgi:enoyl-CoA hydratase/carnithine racemase